MVLFALGQANAALDQVFLPVERQRYACIALLLDGHHDLVQLTAIQEQLTSARWVGVNMGAGAQKRLNEGAEQKCLAILERDLALCNLTLAGTKALHLPSLKFHRRFERFLNEVIVAGLSVLGNRALIFFFRHHVHPRNQKGALWTPLVFGNISNLRRYSMLSIWWRRGDSNPRVTYFFVQFYMRSRLFVLKRSANRQAIPGSSGELFRPIPTDKDSCLPSHF